MSDNKNVNLLPQTSAQETPDSNSLINKVKPDGSNSEMSENAKTQSLELQLISPAPVASIDNTNAIAATSSTKPTVIILSNFSYNAAANQLNQQFYNDNQVVFVKVEQTQSNQDNQEFAPTTDEAASPLRNSQSKNPVSDLRSRLSISFNVLKEQIPKLCTQNKKASRIKILTEAIAQVKELTQENEELKKQYDEQLQKKEKLLSILKKYQSTSN